MQVSQSLGISAATVACSLQVCNTLVGFLIILQQVGDVRWGRLGLQQVVKAATCLYNFYSKIRSHGWFGVEDPPSTRKDAESILHDPCS